MVGRPRCSPVALRGASGSKSNWPPSPTPTGGVVSAAVRICRFGFLLQIYSPKRSAWTSALKRSQAA